MAKTSSAASLPHYPFFLAGQPVDHSAAKYTISQPYDNTPVASVARASSAHLEQAIQAAEAAFAQTRRLPAHERSRILWAVHAGMAAQAEDFARTIAQEAGKPITQARTEVQRALFTFAQAAEEVSRIAGEVLRLDAFPAGEGRQGIVQRFPSGPVAAITPFNFPLNLVAHKLAPAIAAGCPVVLKPAPQTPITALKLADLIHAAGWPAGALSVLPLAVDDAAPLVEDERFRLLTFTGGAQTGWRLKQRAGRKKVVLELGGNAAVIVHSDADIAQAAARCTTGGFAYAGQSCISVQRVYVQQTVYDDFLARFVPAVQALTLGHPLDEQTDLGSLISPQAAERVADWLAEAQAAGARLLCGGGREGARVEPTVVVDAGPDLRLNCQEVFGPVVTVQPYATFDAALAAVNASDYGLQAGVFTNTLKLTWQAFAALEVGGVMSNDIPSWRVDHMPYGGVKASGLGREGLKYAIEDMTEPRLLVLNI